MNKLIFVYNADSGYVNVLADMAHKIFSPATYPCSLCDITYGILKIRPEWDEFVQNSPIPFEFLHKDEFQSAYPAWREIALPIILFQEAAEIKQFMVASELNAVDSVSALKELIVHRLGKDYASGRGTKSLTVCSTLLN